MNNLLHQNNMKIKLSKMENSGWIVFWSLDLNYRNVCRICEGMFSTLDKRCEEMNYRLD